jgi:hypothetical protein
MGNRRLYKIECLHMLGTRESERLKVTALNLFHPTASPSFNKLVISYYDTTSEGGDEEKNCQNRILESIGKNLPREREKKNEGRGF